MKAETDASRADQRANPQQNKGRRHNQGDEGEGFKK
jgi:hypothetical protein